MDSPLKKPPQQRRWWRPWDYWSTTGSLSGADGMVHQLIDAGDAIHIDLSRPFVAHLQAWPLKGDSGEARVSLEIRQDGTEFELQTVLPWSAVPENTPFKMSAAPVADGEAFTWVWTELRTASQMLGQRALPALEAGLYPSGARHPDPDQLPVEEVPPAEVSPGWESPKLGELPWVGTSNAIFTFGFNTRGYIVIGGNCEGVFVIGLNCKGVIVIGFNGIASVAGIGFNMVSPIVPIGFNLLSPLVLIGFNAVTPDVGGTTGVIVRSVMSALLFVGLGFISRFHFKAMKKKRGKKIEDPGERISFVLHRWHAWGYLLGALISLVFVGLWIAFPDLPMDIFEWVFGTDGVAVGDTWIVTPEDVAGQ